MRIGVLGINSKLADLLLRENLAKVCQRFFAANNALHGSHSIVLLSTCNRTELYFSSDNLAETHTYILNLLRQHILGEFDQKLYSYFGCDCFLHLCRVTTGLDSAIFGETEIQGQVKIAYEQTTEYIALPKELHYLFQKSLMIGKKSRTLLPAHSNLLGLEHAIFQAGEKRFKMHENPKILFVGASKINCKVLSYLKGKQLSSITLCNRTQQIAQDIADLYHVELLDWKEIASWHQFDWIIFGTKSNDYIFTQKALEMPFSGSKLLIDLSVPRNVDPRVSEDPRILLLNIDQLNSTLTERRQQMKDFLGQVEELISDFTQRHTLIFNQKRVLVETPQVEEAIYVRH
ncbi:MAG: glutamyl-tRNA reductase [Parachlamydiaceae bacterium]|nr:glutamyl-tRNA reductase [Parachlamydiaceae bacterium]